MITVNIYYTGLNGAARKFAEEMVNAGIVNRIKAQPGNTRYEYFIPVEDPETILLIDSWKNQDAIDKHHASEMMAEIIELREKYDLSMKVERYVSDDLGEHDAMFIRE